jgi:hypothetical protein
VNEDRNPDSTHLRRDGDWWYGANAAFPKAVEWHAWFDYHKDALDGLQPIDRFLVDATVKLQQTYVKIAQRVRKNVGWTRNYTEDEMASIKAVAEEANAWYSRNRPREDQIRGLDPRLLLLFKAIDGAYAVGLRLAQELDAINRKGFVVVDMGAEARELSVSD